jgi:hypothetical protein
MDENSHTVLLRPEKFMTKKSSFELETSHHAKAEKINLPCNQHVIVILHSVLFLFIIEKNGRVIYIEHHRH